MNNRNSATLESSLAQFTGSEKMYRCGLATITDGVKYLCDQAQCYWLMDSIASV